MDIYKKDRKCSKCGGAAQTKYVSAFIGLSDEIKRTCMCCGYVWHEKPLDSKDHPHTDKVNL